MKVKEINQQLNTKGVSQLQKELKDNREKLRDLKFKDSQNQIKHVREIREVKKMIARILTVLKVKNSQRKDEKVKSTDDPKDKK